jgi:hypothetical protein
MKIGISKRGMSAALAFAFVAACAPHAHAEQPDLRRFLVGTWRQPTNVGVNVCQFQADGAFKVVMYSGDGTDPARLAGAWEIRNGNELWTHNMAWYPLYVRHYDGSRTPIHLPPWDSMTIEAIDANHIRIGSGVATRVTR